MPDFHQPSCANQMPQHTADLVIAAKVAEIVAQKHVTPLAGEALQDTGFKIFRLHRLLHTLVSQYDIIPKISTGNQLSRDGNLAACIAVAWSTAAYGLGNPSCIGWLCLFAMARDDH